jgi:undecaprenyl-diphosphatase
MTAGEYAMILDLLKAILFGIVEGLTEWLPISSTGHLILVEEFVHMDVTAEFMEMFRVVIQFGAILAVLVLYFHRLNPFSPKKTLPQKKETFSLWGKVIVALIPLIPVLPLNDKIDAVFYNYKVVALMLIVYGILFIIVENRNRHRVPSIDRISQIDYKAALIIGVFQALAVIPGTSRSGATILGAILIGLSRETAAEFTFFLAIPTMLGASGVKLLKFGLAYTPQEIVILLTGVLVSFLVSIVAIRFLVGYVKKHDFKPFGYYRIVLGALVLVYFMAIAH